MSDQSSERLQLRIGEPFAPARKFWASFVPDSLMSLRQLGPGPKLLLARLYKYAGSEDHCYPGLRTLAADLGTSHDTITRWIVALERGGFIRSVRRQRREAQRLILLAIELLDSLRPPWSDDADLRLQKKQLENAKLRNQKTQNQVLENAKSRSLMTQKRGRLYKEELNHVRGSGKKTPIVPVAASPAGAGDGDRKTSTKPFAWTSADQGKWWAEFRLLYWRAGGDQQARTEFAARVLTERDWLRLRGLLTTQEAEMLARDRMQQPAAVHWLRADGAWLPPGRYCL